MAEAGYPNGFGNLLEMVVFNAFNKVEEASQAIAAQLAAIGLNVRIRFVNAADYGRLSKQRAYDLSLGGHSGGGSFHVSNALISVYSCAGDGHPVFSGFFCDDKLQTMLDKAGATMQVDPVAANNIYRDIQKYCYEVACMAGLWTEHALYGIRSNPRVENLTPSGMLWIYDASEKNDPSSAGLPSGVAEAPQRKPAGFLMIEACSNSAGHLERAGVFVETFEPDNHRRQETNIRTTTVKNSAHRLIEKAHQ